MPVNPTDQPGFAMNRIRTALLLILALPLALAPSALAQEALEIGASLPLPDRAMTLASGGTTTFDAAMGERGLAVVFWSETCPWVEKYTDRIVALGEEYMPAGVGFIAVNANDPVAFPDESLDAIQDGGPDVSFPYVIDEGSTAAAAFGATRTPQVFLFDAAGQLVYEGTVDDSPADPGSVSEEYFRDALGEVVAGVPVSVQKTKAFGCTIKYPS